MSEGDLDYSDNPFEKFDFVDDELKIHNESLFAIEKEVIDHARRAAKYNMYAAKAIEEQEDLEYQLMVHTAQLVDDIYKEAERSGKPLPPTARGEIRKTKVPLDRKWQKLKKKLIKVTARANLFKGLVYSWSTRSHRLAEAVDLSKRTLWNEPRLEVGDDGQVGFKKPLDRQMESVESALDEEE